MLPAVKLKPVVRIDDESAHLRLIDDVEETMSANRVCVDSVRGKLFPVQRSRMAGQATAPAHEATAVAADTFRPRIEVRIGWYRVQLIHGVLSDGTSRPGQDDVSGCHCYFPMRSRSADRSEYRSRSLVALSPACRPSISKSGVDCHQECGTVCSDFGFPAIDRPPMLSLVTQ